MYTIFKKLLVILAVAIHSLAPIPTAPIRQTTTLVTVMYHSILNGTTNKYTVSAKQLSSDLELFKKHGFTPVSTAEVIDFVYNASTLPQKPILVTFDDGCYNNLYYGVDILKQNGFPATFNIVGEYTQTATEDNQEPNANYSYLRWQDVTALLNEGFEIGNHTFAMHKTYPRKGIAKLPNELDSDYLKIIKGDIARLQFEIYNHCNYTPNVFAYPYGYTTKQSKKALKELGFKMLLTCNEGVTTLRQNDYTCLENVKRFNRSGYYDCQTFIQKILKHVKS